MESVVEMLFLLFVLSFGKKKKNRLFLERFAHCFALSTNFNVFGFFDSYENVSQLKHVLSFDRNVCASLRWSLRKASFSVS